MYAINSLSVIPVRKEASDRAEIVSQILFGERVEILDKYQSWRLVRCLHDDYTGWADKKQLQEISQEESAWLDSRPETLTMDMVQLVIWNNHQVLPVLLGSSLPSYKDRKFNFGGRNFAFDGQTITPSASQPSRIVENAYMYLNAPYLWGGRSPFGIDCSGLTQMVFRLGGIRLKRDAWMQAEQGQTVNLLEEAKTGDLIFFDNPEGKIIHTGILIHPGQIIHSSGQVRVDKVDHQGIFNENLGQYSHNLRLIKRIL